MKRVVINENAVRERMGAMGIRSLAELNNRAGLGANTIYSVLGNSFHSRTLDALVNLFGCEPEDLLSEIEDADTQYAAPVGVTDHRQLEAA